MRFDAIAAIEACYRPGDEMACLNGLLEALTPLDEGCGIMAMRLYPDCSTRSGLNLTGPATAGELPDVQGLIGSYREAPPAIVAAHLRPYPPVDRASRRGTRARPPVRKFLAACGADDLLGIMGKGRGLTSTFVLLPIRARFAPRPWTIHQLTRVADHLAAARRLREASHGTPSDPLGVEAVLRPSGEVIHAEGRAREARARADLAEAVRRIERARGSARRTEPDEALSLWNALVNGEWTLVDHCEAGGKRLVLARRNPPEVRDPKALTRAERHAVALAARGASNKLVAFELGVAATTVATRLSSAERKLGLSSRRALIGMFARSEGVVV